MQWNEWLQLFLRWLHVVAAILWIGQTWLFTFLERAFDNSEENPGGRVFMVHSGGLYSVERHRSFATMPKTLHWFQWEAALTWFSGIALLVLVYWTGGLMVRDLEQSTWRAVAIGVAVIVVGWLAYDQLWRRALGRFETAAIAVSYLLLVGAGALLLAVMSPRAAYMHVGALMGSIMAINVRERIIPAQRKMVAAVTAGRVPDAALAATARVRSRHNTFLVLPVVFTMIGSHFPTVSYGSGHPLAVLAALVLVGWGGAFLLRKR